MNKLIKRVLSITIVAIILLFMIGYKAGWFSAGSKTEGGLAVGSRKYCR